MTIEVLSKESPKLKFDKKRLKPFLIKALPSIVGVVIGYIFIDLPGMIIGGIIGHQAVRLFNRFCTKKKSSFR